MKDSSTAALSKYPSQVKETAYGKGLFVTKDVPANTIVEKFVGYDVEYDTLSDNEKCYVLNYHAGGGVWKWCKATTDAIYANHSCRPNSYINDDMEIVTRVALKKGTEITFVYNNGDPSDHWDPIWNFKCHCGADDCQGDVDQYRPHK